MPETETGAAVLEVARSLRPRILDKWRIAPVGVETAIEYLNNVAEPGGALCANEIFSTHAVEIFELRAGEIPPREHCISLLNHRALNQCEGRRDMSSRSAHQPSPRRAYGTTREPGSLRANPTASSAMSSWRCLSTFVKVLAYFCAPHRILHFLKRG
jgi:hypothetical protein